MRRWLIDEIIAELMEREFKDLDLEIKRRAAAKGQELNQEERYYLKRRYMREIENSEQEEYAREQRKRLKD